MRQLSDVEKGLNSKAIERMTERNKELQFLIKKTELDLNEGLDISYRKTKEDYARAIKEFQSEQASNLSQITILQTQNDKGVEEKSG